MTHRKTGVWLVGACGGVATTAAVGLAALRSGRTCLRGLASELPPFQSLDLAGWGDLVLGGHEIRRASLVDEARKLATSSRALDMALVEECRDELRDVDQAIRPGVLFRAGFRIEALADDFLPRRSETPRQSVARLQDDLRAFATTHGLDQVIMVNVASTEPPVDVRQLPERWGDLSRTLDDAQTCTLPSSALYAIAALELGYPYLNFTPSLGSTPPAIDELARQRGTCHMGQDGKTGETLLKSVLAPMFAHRHLEVMSWVGHNIFGNLDGKVLDDPLHKQSKVATKDRILREILGYAPQTLVGIEYIESLGDWKTAWDHIHFRGFLGTPMVLQFIWQGCDSLLAAPLVLDLIRFTERAYRHGDRGLLTFLACFFKSPLGVTEHNFERQYQMLLDWARKVAAG